jgi:hypothetical protein
MHRRDNFDSAPLGKDAGDMQDFRACALHWEVAQRAGIRSRRAVHAPAKRCCELEIEAGMIDDRGREFLEAAEARPQPGQDFRGFIS